MGILSQWSLSGIPTYVFSLSIGVGGLLLYMPLGFYPPPLGHLWILLIGFVSVLLWFCFFF